MTRHERVAHKQDISNNSTRISLPRQNDTNVPHKPSDIGAGYQWPQQTQSEDSGSVPTELVESVEFRQPSQLWPPGRPDVGEPSFDFFDDPSHFQEFENFLDSIGLGAGWTPPDLIHQVETSRTLEANNERGQPSHLIPNESRSDSPFGSWLPSVPQDDQILASIADKGMLSPFL